MNAFVFQMAVVFIPGLTWLSIVDKLTTGTSKRPSLATVLRAFAFGIISYFIWFLARGIYVRIGWGAWPPLPDDIKGAPGIAYLGALRARDVVWTTSLSPLLAIAWSFAANRKYFLRLMKWLNVTRKFGDETVWEYTLNMGTAAVEYVNVRDFERKVVYSGFVRAFSEGGEQRELLLDRAIVYDLETGTEFFRAPLLYLSRELAGLHVEYPYEEQARETTQASEQKGDMNDRHPEGQENGTGRGNPPEGRSELRVSDPESAAAARPDAETNLAVRSSGSPDGRAEEGEVET